MSIIKPTIGRKVWFWPNGSHIGVPAAAQPQSMDPSQAMDATVVLVHDEPKISVNLLVVDHGGTTWPIRSVTLRQEGDDEPQGMYCEWMPYQTAQAKKDVLVGSAIARAMTFGGVNASKAQESPLSVSDATIEQEIVAKGLTAPRVTPADIEVNINSEHYFTAMDGLHGNHRDDAGSTCYHSPSELNLLTFCVLVLRNGFTVTGESACASPENFDAELGRKIARKNAVEKCWPLMGYALKERLSPSLVHEDQWGRQRAAANHQRHAERD